MKVEDINEHKIPPHGWKFYQPETKWPAPTPLSSTLDQTVQLIIGMRKRNSAITAKCKLSTNPEAVKSEVLRYTRKRLGLPEDSTPSPTAGFLRPHEKNGAVAAAADWARKTRTGIQTLADWLGDGAIPVAPELSASRAAICVDCPQNNLSDIASIFTGPIANLIKRQLTERKQLNLSTPDDERLGTCNACGCVMKLKVHIPLATIKEKMKPQERSKLDPRCWVLNEA